jgi:hypothetical protein
MKIVFISSVDPSLGHISRFLKDFLCVIFTNHTYQNIIYFKFNIIHSKNIYNKALGKWLNMEGIGNDGMEFGIRFNSAYSSIGSKFYIWGGTNSDNTPISNGTYIYDFETKKGRILYTQSQSPIIRKNPQGFSVNENFCFIDTWISDTLIDREVWCLTKGSFFNSLIYNISKENENSFKKYFELF